MYTNTDNSWQYSGTLTRNSTGSGEGWSVALPVNGTIVVAGAPFLYGETGGIQVYVKSGESWKYLTTLTQGIQGDNEGGCRIICQ